MVACAVLATVACDHGSKRRGDARAASPKSEPAIAVRHSDNAVRVVEITNWKMAPEACSGPRTDAPVRPETSAAVVAFTRWVALMLDPVGHPAALPWYLERVRQMAAKEGMTTILVPPDGYDIAWEGIARAASLEAASRAASAVAAVRLQVQWAVERGRDASPVRGDLSTHAFEDFGAWTWGSSFFEFCVMPPVDDVSIVYVLFRATA